ncbi:MAG: transcriptional regulator [Thermobacillus sp.]|uniref:ArsR/SmtB family transcription factor n=1 Tax=Thermobacillus TaxID=76632 RepID=UPI000E3784E0|nr:MULTISPECIES: metalloregulator ArsR/SmtB family transcription factor [Thermobacillus]REJ19732.1 MAG: transcriptional regulator [Paenibacillaceae bacterium]REK52339.1 MAG: transcriptional regulator [Thermobacillus sp.]
MKDNRDAVFKALGDPTRRIILDELAERSEMTLFELTTRLIMKHNLSITRQGIAKHLAVLEEAGLVQSVRRGKYRMIRFNREPLRDLLKGWLD